MDLKFSSIAHANLKMPFSKEDLHMIKGLRESKNYNSRQFLREFQKNIGPEAD
jgi:hypothetical protein